MDGDRASSLSAGSRSCFFRTDDCNLLATDIQDKVPKEVKKYYLVFKKKWKQLAGETRSYLWLIRRFIYSIRISQNRTAHRGRRSEA